VKPEDKEHIYLAVPTLDNMMSTGCNWLMNRAQKLNGDANYKYRFSTTTINGRSPVEWMRNCIVHDFFKTDATRLWMVDNDMHPNSKAFDLLEVDGDIVAGFFMRFCHRSESGPTRMEICAYRVDEDNKHRPVQFGPDHYGILDVDAVGTGSCIVRRELLEDKRMWLDRNFTNLAGGKEVLNDEAPPPIFRRRYAPNGQVIIGADLDFCKRARELGYSIKVDTRVQFGQVNKVNLNEMLDMMKRYGDQLTGKSIGNDDITDDEISMVYRGWGNYKWAAPLPFLYATRDLAREAEGDILELGSGATTLILNHMTKVNPNIRVHTIEHMDEWHDKIDSMIEHNGRHTIHRVGLKDYGDYTWYDFDGIELPDKISLVICDGPPVNGQTSRYGLMPQLDKRLTNDFKILADDAHREQETMKRWSKEFGVRVDLKDATGRGVAVISGDSIT
jgi:hypothetical protein